MEVFNYCYYEQYYTYISLFIKENIALMLGVFLGNLWLKLRVGDRERGGYFRDLGGAGALVNLLAGSQSPVAPIERMAPG